MGIFKGLIESVLFCLKKEGEEMTTINLSTQDQHLINANRVLIAAGDVNSVELQVEFDNHWQDFPARSAVFHTSKNSTKHEILLVENKCVVPFEVLAESCILFIGVRGITADGEGSKTSSLVKYSIVEGAAAGDRTLTPTMNLYQQYLRAIRTNADPIIAAIKEEVTAAAKAEMATVSAKAVEMASGLERTVLWENPDPTVEFGATTIEMDLSAFKSFRVIYKFSVLDSESMADMYKTYGELLISEKDIIYSIPQVSNTNDRFREIIISDTSIIIGQIKNTTETAKNIYYVPIKILGYKY